MTIAETIIKKKFFIILLTFFGAFLFFFNLNWGSPFFFHPDERNIASSVSQLNFPNQMNPHFFAYGSLPIYTIYFTGIFINIINKIPRNVVSFEIAIIISRFYSALFATLLIPILFLIGKKMSDEKTGLLTAFLATSSVGLIQFAHFGTFEIWLTFFSILLFLLCLQKINYKIVFFMGIISGFLVAIKISSIILLFIPLAVIILRDLHKKNFIKILINLFLFLIISFSIYFLTNPYVFFDIPDFKNSMLYESTLAIGTLPVFYTGEFFNTTPIIFQFLHIYPFLLNPLIAILFVPTSVYLIFKIVKTKNRSYFLLFVFCSLLFLSQAFLFAKWTRYMVPTLPFAYLIVAIGLNEFLQLYKTVSSTKYFVLSIFVLINSIFAISYFITAFVKPDTRVAAYNFAKQNIPANGPILSEVYDLGIVPFNQTFSNISLFNFYDLDNNSPDATSDILNDKLTTTNYIVLPSQRILKTRLLNKYNFPKANLFYEKILNGDLGFKKIYETPCDIFCKITYLGNPVFSFEETASVFDRPTIMIFKKI